MAASGGLVQHSCIKIPTADGDREIQLLFGDITCLPTADKVDVILVSAFQGDYIPTRTSLIGALHHNLGLSIRELARNKKEDLRQHFHCWQSHTLPANLPYGQLVCFETPLMRGYRHPAELVGEVFRALIPMFQNEEKSVITPLLATGDQNYSRPVMLQAMLDAAISWIRAGLPMKCLKIVMYKQDPSWLSSDEKKLAAIFTKESDKIEQMKQVEQQMRDQTKFDVYLSYNETDRGRVTEISKLLLKEDEKLRIFEEEQHLDKKAAFQDDILDTMRQSCRVVTVLSPAFLESGDCMEKYNLALCVNRRARKNILAPFYIETITMMPTYMTLVQYIDVRDRDGTNKRMLSGVHSFVMTLTLAMQMIVPKPMSVNYDVFISYSHRNSDKANHLLSLFQELDPKLRIFFDRNELKTGFSWQQTLYHAVDNSSVVVALLSPDYVTSTVCQEEYSLALCRHLSETENNKMELVPVLIEPCENLERPMSEVPPLDGTSDFNKMAQVVANAVINFTANKKKNLKVFNPVKIPMDVNSLLAAHRERAFNTHYTVQDQRLCHKELDYDKLEAKVAEYRKTDTFKKKVNELQALMAAEHISREQEAQTVEELVVSDEGRDYVDVERNSKPIYDLDTVYDVAFVCADHLHGAFLDALFHRRAPHVSTNFDVDSEEAEVTALEKARVCVLFLSAKLVTVTKDVEEVDVALARQRRSSAQRMVYPVVISPLPRWPTYVHLIPCNVAVNDQLWVDVMVRAKLTALESLPEDMASAATYLKDRYQGTLSTATMVALSAACDDILTILQSDGNTEDGSKNVVINNLVSVRLSEEKSVVFMKKWNRAAGLMGGAVHWHQTHRHGDGSETIERDPIKSTQPGDSSERREKTDPTTSATCVIL